MGAQPTDTGSGGSGSGGGGSGGGGSQPPTVPTGSIPEPNRQPDFVATAQRRASVREVMSDESQTAGTVQTGDGPLVVTINGILADPRPTIGNRRLYNIYVRRNGESTSRFVEPGTGFGTGTGPLDEPLEVGDQVRWHNIAFGG